MKDALLEMVVEAANWLRAPKKVCSMVVQPNCMLTLLGTSVGDIIIQQIIPTIQLLRDELLNSCFIRLAHVLVVSGSF